MRNGEELKLNSSNDLLLKIEKLTKHFPLQKSIFDKMVLKNRKIQLITQAVHALNGISIGIRKGETLGLVGESGCGKSTLAKTIVGLHPPTSGRIWYGSREIGKLKGRERKPFQKKIQMVFQDPFFSLNPRKKVMHIIGQPMEVHHIARGQAKKERVMELLEKVGMDPAYAFRYPHQFSGGQRQRIGIARALASDPELVIADEPISALDVSIQAQILNLMMQLQEELDLTYLFVSHDLSVIKHISSRVAVMYLGYIVESASTDDIFSSPNHPYTRILFSAIPSLDKLEFVDGLGIKGEVPTPINLPSGCPFHPRCPNVFEHCRKERPELKEIGPNRFSACHLNER
jgi:oligopeptide/dipeptide ABC transporter ATP-binding protein